MKLQDLLNDHGVRFAPQGHHHSRPGWLQLDCPQCSRNSQRWRLGYNTYGNYFTCWSCGHLSFRDALTELTGRPWAELKGRLSDLETESRPRGDIPRGTLEIPSGVGSLRRCHRDYLRERGFVPKDIKRLWNVQGIGMASQLAWRLFIPIELHGEMVSWTSRSINDYGLRYVSAKLTQESFPHKRLLYGEDYARHTIIIHEGPLDVWTVGPGAVGTLGTSYTRAQVVRMAQYLRRIVCFDNEPNAQRRARKLCDDLEPFEGETYNVILDAKDANSAAAKEIRRLRRLYLD